MIINVETLKKSLPIKSITTTSNGEVIEYTIDTLMTITRVYLMNITMHTDQKPKNGILVSIGLVISDDVIKVICVCNERNINYTNELLLSDVVKAGLSHLVACTLRNAFRN